MTMWRHRGIKRVAIVDFDVHHGNGTEDIINGLRPMEETFSLTTPFSEHTMKTQRFNPFLGDEDTENVLFVSTHGFGKKDDGPKAQWFYPGSGCTALCQVSRPCHGPFAIQAVASYQAPEEVEAPRSAGDPQILNVGFQLPAPDDLPGTSRLQWRDAYRKVLCPKLMDFKPDLILISAGFDAHKKEILVGPKLQR